MTDHRYWGILACTFLIGANIALVMAVSQDQHQINWSVSANCLTLCFALCLHFRHEAQVEDVATKCEGFKILILACMKKATRKRPVKYLGKSELEVALNKFPRIRGDR